MSKRFDDSFIHIPADAREHDSFYADDLEYRRIKNIPEYYINYYGDVISFYKEEPIVMKQYQNKHGHRYVDLRCCGQKIKCIVHRLIAEAFIQNPNNYPVVRHLDDEPSNNCIDNLAWGTQMDNRNDCIKNGNDFAKPVYCFENEKTYKSGTEAAKELGLFKSQITLCCQGKRGQTKGYHFCFDNEKEEKLYDKKWTKKREGFKPVIAYKDNEELYFNSRKVAAKSLNINGSSISNVISGRLKQAGGWKFREGENN